MAEDRVTKAFAKTLGLTFDYKYYDYAPLYANSNENLSAL